MADYFLQGYVSTRYRKSVSTGESFMYCVFLADHATKSFMTLARVGIGFGAHTNRLSLATVDS